MGNSSENSTRRRRNLNLHQWPSIECQPLTSKSRRPARCKKRVRYYCLALIPPTRIAPNWRAALSDGEADRQTDRRRVVGARLAAWRAGPTTALAGTDDNGVSTSVSHDNITHAQCAFRCEHSKRRAPRKKATR